MSLDQIRAALDTIDVRPRDGFLSDLGEQLVAAWPEVGGEVGGDVDYLPVGETNAPPHVHQHRLRWLQVAAATIVVVGLGLLTVVARREDERPRFDTVPLAPAPTTTVAPAPEPIPTSTLVPPLPGQEITVTEDLVEFGDRLVGLIGNMDRADGRTYVIGGHNPSGERSLIPPDEAVLAAFDDSGTELWRTELDRRPIEVIAVGDDLWVLHEMGMTQALSLVDPSDGTIVGEVALGNVTALAGGFGSVWVQVGDVPMSARLLRVDHDLAVTTIEVPDRVFSEIADPWPDGVAAGPDAVWVPLGDVGVAMIDPESLEVSVIPAEEIGHDVQRVAFDGDVTYVAGRSMVTSILDGRVRATVAPGWIEHGLVVTSAILYLGPMDGAFGVQLVDGRFAVLGPDEPMVVERRRTSDIAIPREIDGEAWVETGANYHLRRVGFVPEPGGGG